MKAARPVSHNIAALGQSRQELQGADRRQEKVAAALDRDKARNAIDLLSNRIALNGHAAGAGGRSVVITDQRIFVIVQPVELRIVDPCLLNELKLALNVGIDTHEHQSDIIAGVGR